MARDYWLESMRRIAEPVLLSLSQRKLKRCLPVSAQDREVYSPLEAFGRSLAGLAPWLELKAKFVVRKQSCKGSSEAWHWRDWMRQPIPHPQTT